MSNFPEFRCTRCGKKLKLRETGEHNCDGNPFSSEIDENIDRTYRIDEIAPSNLLREISVEEIESIAEDKKVGVEHIESVSDGIRSSKHYFKMGDGYCRVNTDGLFFGGNTIGFDDVGFAEQSKIVTGIFEKMLNKRKPANSFEKKGSDNSVNVVSPRKAVLDSMGVEKREKYLKEYFRIWEKADEDYRRELEELEKERNGTIIDFTKKLILVKKLTDWFFNQLEKLDEKYIAGDVDE